MEMTAAWVSQGAHLFHLLCHTTPRIMVGLSFRPKLTLRSLCDASTRICCRISFANVGGIHTWVQYSTLFCS